MQVTAEPYGISRFRMGDEDCTRTAPGRSAHKCYYFSGGDGEDGLTSVSIAAGLGMV